MWDFCKHATPADGTPRPDLTARPPGPPEPLAAMVNRTIADENCPEGTMYVIDGAAWHDVFHGAYSKPDPLCPRQLPTESREKFQARLVDYLARNNRLVVITHLKRVRRRS